MTKIDMASILIAAAIGLIFGVTIGERLSDASIVRDCSTRGQTSAGSVTITCEVKREGK